MFINLYCCHLRDAYIIYYIALYYKKRKKSSFEFLSFYMEIYTMEVPWENDSIF